MKEKTSKKIIHLIHNKRYAHYTKWWLSWTWMNVLSHSQQAKSQTQTEEPAWDIARWNHKVEWRLEKTKTAKKFFNSRSKWQRKDNNDDDDDDNSSNDSHSFIHSQSLSRHVPKKKHQFVQQKTNCLCVYVCVQNNDIATYINYVLLLVSPLCFSKKKKNLPLHIPHTHNHHHHKKKLHCSIFLCKNEWKIFLLVSIVTNRWQINKKK